MPFAFALIKGEADTSECCQLTEEEKNSIFSVVRKCDWKEDLIIRLKGELKLIRLDEVSENLGAEYRGDRLFLKCFGKHVIVGQDGEIETERILSPWMKMLLLFYIKSGGSGGLSGKWVFHNELKGGMMKDKAFRRECEEPLKELFDQNLTGTGRLLDEYGATHPEGFETRNAWLLHVFPKLPVLLLYWPKDEEFESSVAIRFDSTADKYFDVEQLIFLVEELINDIKASQ
jgi:hypothetical protein